ncbi:MAG: A/G-specific adenine glycosylase, partial [Bdellovibrionaceae bacterium]|nr:A/G-specific adenine glycosylase [Pseudobdellovibrionaceae bacterium]
NPYLIWISEVMLQQTTVTAVIPFYEKFIKRFPDINTLAKARLENVYEYWAGLGYYSRARNLHKAAQIVVHEHKAVFPKTYQELIELPGFGPYTSRAVASLAYDQPVGVLDGNVIRILSRKYGLDLKWWENKEKEKLQFISDQLAGTKHSADLNQAMMELGATVCTPKKVMCFFCPWNKTCVSYATDTISQRPLSKPKVDFEIWSWHFEINTKKSQIFLTQNAATPFLKENWLPVSTALKLTQKPKDYHFKHGVTKYDIYVSVATSSKSSSKNGKWVNLDEVSQVNPTSLIKKLIKAIE